jgi:hypothetical protein
VTDRCSLRGIAELHDDPSRTLLDPGQTPGAREAAADALAAQATPATLAVLIAAGSADHIPFELARHIGKCIARHGGNTFTNWDLRDLSGEVWAAWDEEVVRLRQG